MSYFINVAEAGIITDAPKLSEVFGKVFINYLSIFGYLVIIVSVAIGIVYLTASGNEKRIAMAKKATVYVVIGTCIALGSVIIIRTIIKFFS